MQTEWDEAKNRANFAKHGISFDEAATVLSDPLASIFDDIAHSDDEERNFTIGLSSMNRLLVVIWTVRGDNVRLISARPATKREQQNYEHGNL